MPQVPTSKQPHEARKPQKIPPARPPSKNLFSGEQTENRELQKKWGWQESGNKVI
jgi:hypothetical protein